MSNTVLNKGILIKSNALISCYYDISNGLNGDIFSLKGRNGLGFKFTIPSQKAFNGYDYNSGYYCDIIVCATENNTSITISPITALVGHPANIPFTIVLQRGQTYVCRAANGNPTERPGGTLIVSNRAIAVTLKDDSIQYPGFGCADTAGDQLIPDNNTGTDFVVVKGYLYQPDNFYIYAINDNTTVTVDGTLVATLNSGEYYRGILSSNASYVQTSADVHLFQISGFGCEIGGAEIPSLRCTGSTSVSVTRATSQRFFINIIAPSNIIGNFSFNGNPNIILASMFLPVANSNGAWMYTKYEADNTIMPAGGVAKVSNTAGKFHMGIIHGDEGSTTRFGFFSDFSKGRFTFNYDTLYCARQNIQISGNLNGSTNYQ